MTKINDGGPAFPRDERYLGHNRGDLRQRIERRLIDLAKDAA
ncbi:hypothetical protein [Bordetella avium]|uniref:Phage protein n=1 Tax=Bordetella avium (strain 197N) TaxID=360910 RepID=Q2KZ84_BORA1|nr:hypothetical protein [Bordetella avium]UOK17044.1 hypothetical protein vBBaMIFTN1_42 [Bordetella phage vB_BaM-IFTN1]UOK17172.1 hypothetical protein vBBaMIFTN3_43 [Bordetella phage vB_BaM-IFTN3]UOK17235.1 hypothetical protein vBBaMIFTN4_43 [Bordetella phage vB_BaM-IFTN4]UOK17310.1 hypothetical protein vBBaMIFTN5_46 [Bordetella phage vB_BaM-IFTN5]UOK17377.1 hypothetical protein vBBaMIFTN6_44 [Bordetella phage vB_BaM-IFTN6]UOK17442.1 hypothetical protein vBBaMIFTN7_45 [Bordetella phage vB_BaM